MGSYHFQYQAQLGTMFSDCLFQSSKKANAAVSIWVEFPVEMPSSQYLSFTSSNRRKAFECCIESGGVFFSPHNFSSWPFRMIMRGTTSGTKLCVN